MVRKNKIEHLIVILFLLLIIPISSYALPPLPTEFYGNITNYDAGASSGGVITAVDPTNITCGRFTIVNQGKYGLLTCSGDDNYTTLLDEGPINTQSITFYLDGAEVSAIGDATYTDKTYKNVWLVYPKIRCGNSFCNENFENCADCPEDCGVCPSPQPPPSNDGGGGGAGGGAADGGGADGSKIIDSFACEEDWYCSDWSVCYENETQSRTCTDLNACQTINDKPPVLQECIFEGDCFDGVQNGLEEGIDCGGLCEPCPWQIGEPSCFDGIQNQGERGVDCEGPCQKECKKKKPLLEFPMKVCKREFNLTNPVYWLFVLIVLIAITTDLTYSYQRINRVRRNEEIEDLKRAKTIIHTKRNMYIFIIIIVLMSLGLLAYYYYYSQCSSYLIDFLWLVISVFILVPVIGYTTLKILEYDEREKIMKMEKYFEAHHSHITHLISMHNKYLVEIENDISNEIYQLQSDDKFKDVLENYPQIREAYKEMIILYDKYKETSTPFDEERRLCKDMEELIKNKEFVKLTTSFPKIKKLYDDLVLLYKQYEEKQKMYDDLFREERKTKQE